MFTLLKRLSRFEIRADAKICLLYTSDAADEL